MEFQAVLGAAQFVLGLVMLADDRRAGIYRDDVDHHPPGCLTVSAERNARAVLDHGGVVLTGVAVHEGFSNAPQHGVAQAGQLVGQLP
ncbi:MAG TPA: hypothetical protein VGL99_21885 [Chloroflexota bacterium]|jgi:D-serine deaminase-like pyridoxal phosphate-dependent protein